MPCLSRSGRRHTRCNRPGSSRKEPRNATSSDRSLCIHLVPELCLRIASGRSQRSSERHGRAGRDRRDRDVDLHVARARRQWRRRLHARLLDGRRHGRNGHLWRLLERELHGANAEVNDSEVKSSGRSSYIGACSALASFVYRPSSGRRAQDRRLNARRRSLPTMPARPRGLESTSSPARRGPPRPAPPTTPP